MSGNKKDELSHDHNNDGVNRRGFLKCMAWAGTGTFCVMQGGVLNTHGINAGDTHAGWIPAVREWRAFRRRLDRVFEAHRHRPRHQTVRTSQAGALLAE